MSIAFTIVYLYLLYFYHLMNPQILLAIEDENVGILLCEYLHAKAFDVDMYPTADEAAAATGMRHYNFCIIAQENIDAQNELIRDIHRSCSAPIFALQREFSKDAQLSMYEAGADDCIVLPIIPDLLICKINAMLKRRLAFEQNLPTIFTCNEVVFDSVKQTLLIGETDIHLSAKESQVLLLLWRSEGQLVDRSLILKSAWQADNYFNSRSLSVYINHLRKYAAETSCLRIMSIHGRGYKLITSREN